MPKIIRDPIWGDIKLNDDEVRVIDTSAFQRLRGIRQLGLAYLVYPGAIHSRFLHSIGTVSAVQQIINAMESEGIGITSEERNDIRMIALLHDIGHTPFSHLLEDEANLYTRHDSKERLKKRIDSIETPISDQSKQVLLGNSQPEKEFMKDMVSNTICADMIDYIQRDGHFSGATGLRFHFDERLLSYFRKVPDRMGSIHLAIEPIKDKIRMDVITDLLQLLRYRYVLTERLTYHHAKLAANAMLVKAVTAAGQPALEEFEDMSDDQFLHFISQKTDENKVPQRLIDDLARRRLYKPVFRVTRAAVSKKMHVDEFCRKYGTPAGRDSLERQIIDVASRLIHSHNLREGDLVIYTPHDDSMTMKEVGVLVHWKGKEAIPLRDVLAEEYWETVTLDEVRALENRYRALWTSSVFVDPALQMYKYEIEKACERVLEMENDPLLSASLKKEQDYADMIFTQSCVDDVGLARKAVQLSQRIGSEKLSREERLRRGVDEAIRISSKSETKMEKSRREVKSLDDINNEN